MNSACNKTKTYYIKFLLELLQSSKFSVLRSKRNTDQETVGDGDNGQVDTAPLCCKVDTAALCCQVDTAALSCQVDTAALSCQVDKAALPCQLLYL